MNTTPDILDPAVPASGPTDRSTRLVHPANGMFPPHDAKAPILTGLDMAVLLALTVITLGPLAAYAFAA